MASIRAEPPVRAVAALTLAAAVGALLAALVLNPWVAGWLRPGWASLRGDALRDFALCAIGAVAVLGLIGVALLRAGRSLAACRWVILTVSLVTLILGDRLLLVAGGARSLWEADRENHYRHRPGAERSWGPTYGNKILRINRWGHHDDEFPELKPPGELRGLVLGDSIPMGHGVTSAEAFPNRLEPLLARAAPWAVSVQVINTGVQGYSTFQELHVLERSLRFSPDFVVVGFCLNDLTEPFVVNRRFGGIGSDYHGVFQVDNRVVSWLVNETGWGSLAQKFGHAERKRRLRARWGAYAGRIVAAAPRDDPRIAAGWDLVLRSLAGIYGICEREGLPVVLVVFPFTWQLGDPAAQVPQRVLAADAAARGVPVLDFTPVFEQLITTGKTHAEPADGGPGIEAALTRDLTRLYFLDRDHYTPLGHEVVAERLALLLEQQVLPAIARSR